MKIRNLSLIIAGSALVAGATSVSAQVFTPGDLVVTTYGSATGTSLLDGQVTPITLTEFALPTATSATVAMTDVLPISGTGANVGIVGEYGSSSEGSLQVSGNGQYLTIGGYDGNLDTRGGPYGGSNTALAQSTDTNVPRVAATINLSTGAVNTSTVLNDVYNTNNARSVYSPDGTTLLLSGQGAGKGDQGGLYQTTVGTNTTTGGAAPTGIYNTSSTRTVKQANFNAANGTASATPNTYVAIDQDGKGFTNAGIFENVSNGAGSSIGTRITPANNGKTGSAAVAYSPEDFVFANATTLYVADTGVSKLDARPTVGDGGIQKWSFIAGTWTLDYTLRPSTFVDPASADTVSHGETGFSDLTLRLDGSNVDIYAVSYTAGDADPNGLYAIQDNLNATTESGETFTELAQGSGLSNVNGQDQNFKGVAIVPGAVPEPSTTAMSILALLGLAGFAWKRRNMLKA